MPGNNGTGLIDSALGAQAKAEACAKRLDLLIERSFRDLEFLSNEFVKLERALAPEPSFKHGSTAAGVHGGGSGEAAEELKLAKLRFFTDHVRRTMARMRDARSGRDPLSFQQLALLEEHIATSIVPVKERLVSQMNRISGRGSNGGGRLLEGVASASVARAPSTDLASVAAAATSSTLGRSGSFSSTSSAGAGSSVATRHEVSSATEDGDYEAGPVSTSRSSSVSSGMGGSSFCGESSSSQDGRGEAAAAAAAAGVQIGGDGGGGRQDSGWSVGMEFDGEVFDGGSSVSLSLITPAPAAYSAAANGVLDSSPPPYSPAYSRMTRASSGASFSRLCWSGGRSGGGPEVVAEAGRGSLSLTPEEDQSRRDHLDMLSELEAEGVFAADDSYSPCGGGESGICSSLLGGVAFSPFVTPDAVGGPSSWLPPRSFSSPSLATAEGACGGGSSGDGGGVCGGDLSPVPLKTVKQEGVEKGAGGPARGAATSAPSVKNVVKPELSEESAFDRGGAGGEGGGATAAAPVVALTDVAAAPAASPFRNSPARSAAACGPSSVYSGHRSAAADMEGSLKATSATAPFIRPKCEPVPGESGINASAVSSAHTMSCTSSAAAAAGGGGASTTSTAIANHESAASTVAAPGTSPGAAVAVENSATRKTKAAPPAVAAAQPGKPLSSASAGGGNRGGGGMLTVPPRPAKRRRSPNYAAALLQPREVRYQCGACSQSYAATVTGNPWWLLVRQECPSCHKLQIPRVDILHPTNNVEGHVACLTDGCVETGSDGDGSYMDWDGDTSDDTSGDEFSADEREGPSTGGGVDVDGGGWRGSGGGSGAGGSRGRGLGPSLDSEQAAKLLVLMCHARDCPGNHHSPRLAEVCRSVKFLMLHLRDCDGRTLTGEPCPMPWCAPCTSLLHHLIQCPESTGCQVCNPLHLPPPLRDLRALNHSSTASSAAQSSQPPPPPPPPLAPPPPTPAPAFHDRPGGNSAKLEPTQASGAPHPSEAADKGSVNGSSGGNSGDQASTQHLISPTPQG